MFKFYIPLQKGLELRPYQNYPVPIVRVLVHADELVPYQKMAELADKAQKIFEANRAQIQHWCNARRQEYGLNGNTIEKKQYDLDRAKLIHTILFNQEVIEVHIYPQAEEKERDEPCLMIVSGNKLYAFPMSSLSTPTTMAPIYKKTLTKTNLSNDPVSHLSAGTGYKQYKFEGAKLGFVLSRVKFEADRMRVVEDSVVTGAAQIYISPASPALNVSHPVPDNSLAAVNGSNQDIYIQSGTYRYTGSAVTQIASTTFAPSYVIPYAIDSSGTYYFDLRSNTTQYSGHAFTLSGDYGYLTDAMNTTDTAQFFLYGTNIWAGNVKSPQARTAYGTVPTDTLLYKYAYDFGFAYGTYTPDPPITDFSLNVKVPVFYTGSGDRIQLETRSVTASTEVTWYDTVISGSTFKARDTTLAVTFGGYSYTKTDIGRDFGIGFNSTRPQLTISVMTKQPAANGVYFRVYRHSQQHTNWLGNTVDEDLTEYRLYGPTGLLLTNSTGINFFPVGHASNGKAYLQAYVGTPGAGYSVFINGTDAFARLTALGLPSPNAWNLAVMDIPLSRIKKFL